MKQELEQAAGRTVSRETFEKLEGFAGLLKAENARQNLVSPSTLANLWSRHILDSAQLVRFEPFVGASWADIGAGAGLPGIVIACLVEGPVTLIEPRRLRAEFLHRVSTELRIDVDVRQKKVESVEGWFDVVTARAVAKLSKLLEISAHLSTNKTRWILPKGRGANVELAEARRSWHGMFHVERSLTDDESFIIVGTGVRSRR